MDIKLIISADESALRFAELIGSGIARNATEKKVVVGTNPYVEFTTQDVKLETAPVDQPEKIETIEDVVAICEDMNELRAQIKSEAIRVVKEKKRDALKALNAKYGIEKVHEIKSSDLHSYLAEVKEL